jgi:DNA (cytosine-5)-methyltransferase 1
VVRGDGLRSAGGGGMKKLKVLDLFSGIGGFSLGLERTGGFETVAFCEIEPFPRRVLAKHWPEVPCYEDVRTLTAERLTADGIAVDFICGGFPCQDISLAGEGAGLDGERSGLWSEIARLVGELRPVFVVVENVSALLGRGLGRVLGDLAALGYDAEWHCISAAFVGRPQLRDRIWIVAYPYGEKLERGALTGSSQTERAFASKQLGAMAAALARISAPAGSSGGISYGVPHRMDRLAALGNAVVPQIPELIGHAILASRAVQTLEAAE